MGCVVHPINDSGRVSGFPGLVPGGFSEGTERWHVGPWRRQ